MKSDDSRGPSLPAPPDVAVLEPQMMTTPELHSALQELFDWLHMAEAAPRSQEVDEDQVQEVRDAANALLEEQRERHSDESAPRGG